MDGNRGKKAFKSTVLYSALRGAITFPQYWGNASVLNFAVQKKHYSWMEYGNGFFSLNKINKLEEGKYLLEAL